jgi:Rab3 GTPase-activating protein catalytic subunit
MTRFITELHARPEMPIKDAASSRLGKKLVSMFTVTKPSTNQSSDSSEVKNQFITPAGREYILRASIPRPSQSRSRPSPQRMYCMLAQDEFRLCGAFSEDTTFF